jgi:hypothetical protein
LEITELSACSNEAMLAKCLNALHTLVSQNYPIRVRKKKKLTHTRLQKEVNTEAPIVIMVYVYADEPGLTSSVTCHDDTILVFQGND